MTELGKDDLPGVTQWQSPMAWVGSPLRPVRNYSRDFPPEAVLVRAEVMVTRSEEIGPGIFREEELALPGLIRLADCKPLEVYAPSPSGECWTWRLVKEGRKRRWLLFVDVQFPARPAQGPVGRDKTGIAFLRVQSILPMYGSGKHISFLISEDGKCEDLAALVDPDPND